MKPWERAPGAVKLGRRDSKITFRRMVGSSYKQRWLYITTIENLFFFFFFSIASAQEAAVMIFFKISAEWKKIKEVHCSIWVWVDNGPPYLPQLRLRHMLLLASLIPLIFALWPVFSACALRSIQASSLPVLPGDLQIVRFLDPLLYIEILDMSFLFDPGKKSLSLSLFILGQWLSICHIQHTSLLPVLNQRLAIPSHRCFPRFCFFLLGSLPSCLSVALWEHFVCTGRIPGLSCHIPSEGGFPRFDSWWPFVLPQLSRGLQWPTAAGVYPYFSLGQPIWNLLVRLVWTYE